MTCVYDRLCKVSRKASYGQVYEAMLCGVLAILSMHDGAKASVHTPSLFAILLKDVKVR